MKSVKGLPDEILRVIADRNPHGVLVSEASSGRVVHINPVLRKSLKFSKHEEQSLHIEEIEHILKSHFQVQKLILKPEENKQDIIEADFSSTRQAEASLETTIDEFSYDGTSYFVSIIRNISQKEEERIIDSREEFYRTLTERSIEGVSITDSNGNILYLNPAFESIMGYSREEVIGDNLLTYTHPEDASLLAEKLREAITQNDHQNLHTQIRYRHKNGSWRIIEGSTINLTHNPLVKGLLSTFRDVTEREQTKAELENKKTYLRKIINALPFPIWTKDQYGRYVHANEALANNLGVTLEEIVGKTDMDFSDEDRSSANMEEDAAVLLSNEPLQARYKELTPRNSPKSRHVLVHLVPLVVGERSEVLGTAVDITELKEAKDFALDTNTRLEEVNRQLERFLYSTSHELRGPLTSMKGVLNLLTCEYGQEGIFHYISMMNQCIHKLEGTLHQISQYMGGRDGIKVAQVQFDYLVKAALEKNAVLATGKHIEVSTAIQADLPFYSDPQRIRLMLDNLLSNAYRFCDQNKEGPSIDVNIETIGNAARISISDNGEGISRESLPKIFDLFFRGSERSGSGMGLFIVKDIVSRLQGNIEVESTPGAGTVFKIWLPSLEKNNNVVAAKEARSLPRSRDALHTVLPAQPIPSMVVNRTGSGMPFMGVA